MSDKDPSGNESSDEYECPWDGCDYTSHSEHGIKCHHPQAHGESLGGEVTECEICGDTFRYQPAGSKGRFCSNDCYGTWLSENNTGENNPTWKEKVVVECAACGKDLKRRPCRIEEGKDHFCDQICHGKWLTENNVGENHPSYNSVKTACGYCGESIIVKRCHYEDFEENYCDRGCANKAQVGVDHGNSKGVVRNPKYEGVPRYTEHECEWCGETVLKDRYHPDVSQYFCDEACHNAWQLERGPKGSDHWNWRGGRAIYNSVRDLLPGPSWYRITKDQRDQANGECAVCGEHEGKIDIHHIVPVLSGGTNMDELLMPLCPSHHMTTEWFIRRFIDPHLVDWSEDELPEDRVPSQEYMSNISE